MAPRRNRESHRDVPGRAGARCLPIAAFSKRWRGSSKRKGELRAVERGARKVARAEPRREAVSIWRCAWPTSFEAERRRGRRTRARRRASRRTYSREIRQRLAAGLREDRRMGGASPSSWRRAGRRTTPPSGFASTARRPTCTSRSRTTPVRRRRFSKKQRSRPPSDRELLLDPLRRLRRGGGARKRLRSALEKAVASFAGKAFEGACRHSPALLARLSRRGR